MSRRGCTLTALCLCLSSAPLACGNQASTSSRIVVDSAGVSIVHLGSAETEELRLAANPSLQVGSAPTDADEPLYRVVGVARMARELVVGNGGSNQIFYYDLEGNRLRSVGRGGGGPGEFERLSAIFALPGDSLLAYDTGLRRFQVFDREGRFVRSFILGNADSGNPPPGVVPLGVVADRNLIVRSLRIGPGNEPESNVHRATMDVLRYSLTGEFLDTLISTPGWEAYSSAERGLGNMPIPFGHSSHLATTADHLILGLNESNEVRFYGVDGNLRQIIRSVAPPGPQVEEQEIEEFVARAVQRAPRGMSADLKAIYDEMPFPQVKPPFYWVYSGADGSIWVGTHHGDESSRRMLILDTGYARSAWLSLPRELSPLEVRRESVLGVWTDEMGVETIREYPIRKSGS